MKKCVIGLKNPTFQARNENSDDVGIDQAADLRFAFREIAVGKCKRQRVLLLGLEQAHVFDGARRLASEGLQKRDLFVVQRPDFQSPYENYAKGRTLAEQQRRN